MDDVPRSKQFDDVYFSADGGPEETTHVFLNGNDLPGAWQGRDRFVIGETGFGTGLNFLLAWELFERTAKPGAFLDFISVEKYPLSVDEIGRGLAPWAARLEPYLGKMLAQYPLRVPGFHRMVFDGRVALTLIFDDANEALPQIEASVDAWFMDGFTPAKNPGMWTETVFAAMARLSHPATSFATFTAAGFVKRGLAAAGFAVEKRRGFGRKRDMLVGFFQGRTPHPNLPPLKGGKASDLLKSSPRLREEDLRACPGEGRGGGSGDSRDGGIVQNATVHILGAGLAGTACAYVLKQYGFMPRLYDPNGIASGASGNSCGLINPRFSAARTAQSDVYTAGYALAARTLPDMGDVGYRRCGSVHLITDEARRKRLEQSLANWGWHDDHMRWLNTAEASDVAGVTLHHEALYLPDGGMVDPARLCRAYAKDIPVEKEYVETEGDIVIHANGPALAGLDWLKLQTVRGQLTFAEPTALSKKLQTALCYGGYISPVTDGQHAIGATFQKWLSDTSLMDEDDADNLAKLSEVVPELTGFKIAGSRAALRTAARDRFPVVGRMPHKDHHFISTALGSHGILMSLAAAHLLADYLRGGPFCLGRDQMAALNPMRFALCG